MSTQSPKIYVYQGLPSGGAKVLFSENLRYLKKRTEIIKFDENLQSSNFASYIYLALNHKNAQYRKFQKKTTIGKDDILLAYHSWVTKSPNIFKDFPGKIIYICHEIPREYYDPEHRAMQTAREKIINLLRYPVKWNDQYNLWSAKRRLTLVANSSFEARLIEKVYRIRPTIIYPGIDVAKFKTLKTSEKINQAISVGAINKYKNQLFYVEVLGKLPKSIRPALLLVGNGVNREYLDEIKRKAEALGVKLRIRINVSMAKLANYYSESKVFLYAPISEPFGLVVLEAMAAGLPVICAKHGGGYAEIMTKKNGAILPRDEDIWATKITTLLKDYRLAQKIKYYNLKHVHRFTTNQMNKQLWDLIKKS